MADYSTQAATADRLIDKFGGDATLIKSGGYTGPDYDKTPLPDIETTITIVDLDIKQDDRAGTLVGTQGRVIYAKASAAIEKGDKVRINGVVHGIAMVSPLQPAPGAQVIFYEATLEI